jgi:hypothetical protein
MSSSSSHTPVKAEILAKWVELLETPRIHTIISAAQDGSDEVLGRILIAGLDVVRERLIHKIGYVFQLHIFVHFFVHFYST